MAEKKSLKDKVSDFIQKTIQETPKGEKADMAEFIAVQATIFGSYNTYEGIGILDVAKTEYLRLCEEFYEDEENPCKDCNQSLN